MYARWWGTFFSFRWFRFLFRNLFLSLHWLDFNLDLQIILVFIISLFLGCFCCNCCECRLWNRFVNVKKFVIVRETISGGHGALVRHDRGTLFRFVFGWRVKNAQYLPANIDQCSAVSRSMNLKMTSVLFIHPTMARDDDYFDLITS